MAARAPAPAAAAAAAADDDYDNGAVACVDDKEGDALYAKQPEGSYSLAGAVSAAAAASAAAPRSFGVAPAAGAGAGAKEKRSAQRMKAMGGSRISVELSDKYLGGGTFAEFIQAQRANNALANQVSAAGSDGDEEELQRDALAKKFDYVGMHTDKISASPLDVERAKFNATRQWSGGDYLRGVNAVILDGTLRRERTGRRRYLVNVLYRLCGNQIVQVIFESDTPGFETASYGSSNMRTTDVLRVPAIQTTSDKAIRKFVELLEHQKAHNALPDWPEQRVTPFEPQFMTLAECNALYGEATAAKDAYKRTVHNLRHHVVEHIAHSFVTGVDVGPVAGLVEAFVIRAAELLCTAAVVEHAQDSWAQQYEEMVASVFMDVKPPMKEELDDAFSFAMSVPSAMLRVSEFKFPRLLLVPSGLTGIVVPLCIDLDTPGCTKTQRIVSDAINVKHKSFVYPAGRVQRGVVASDARNTGGRKIYSSHYQKLCAKIAEDVVKVEPTSTVCRDIKALTSILVERISAVSVKFKAQPMTTAAKSIPSIPADFSAEKAAQCLAAAAAKPQGADLWSNAPVTFQYSTTTYAHSGGMKHYSDQYDDGKTSRKRAAMSETIKKPETVAEAGAAKRSSPPRQPMLRAARSSVPPLAASASAAAAAAAAPAAASAASVAVVGPTPMGF